MSNKLNFYSFLNFKGDYKLITGNLISELKISIKYPCVFLVRNNSWNDYFYVSQFYAFYFSKENDFIELGPIKIININSDFETSLDESFSSLDQNIFFSKAYRSFYQSLKELEKGLGDRILGCLNEIVYKKYSAQFFFESKNENLIDAYMKSLIREIFESNEKYLKSAEDMISKLLMLANGFNDNDLAILNQYQLNLFYGSAVATFESFLKNAFMYYLFESKNSENYILNFYNYYMNKLKKQELEIITYENKKFFKFKNSISNIKDKIKENLRTKSFTDINFIKTIYKVTFNFDLPQDLSYFKIPLEYRHLIFHCNGYDEDQNLISISKNDLLDLLNKLKHFLINFESKIKKELC